MKRLNLLACASAFLLILACASAAEEGAEGAAQPEGSDRVPAGELKIPEGLDPDLDKIPADEWKRMASQAQQVGQYDVSAKILEMAVQRKGTAEMWNLLGEAYYELERYLESYEAFQTALEVDPKYLRATANMEKVKKELSQLGAEGAEGASADDLRRMAQQERRQGEYGKAAALLEQAVQKDGTAETWNLLGETYYDQERYVEAYEAFETALEIDPKYTRAVANMELVKWALPQPGFEDSMQQRFSTPKTIGAQILGSYFTGTAMGGWLLFVASVMGYKETDDQLTIMASGLVLSSMMRVPEVGRLVSFGHGASRSAFAGAVLPPLIGALVVKLSNENPTRRDLIHGARIGAIFSPLVSTLGYHLSTSRLFRRPSSTAQHTPFERTETQLSMQFAQFSF